MKLQEQSGEYDLVNIVSATMKKMIKYFDGDVKRINHAQSARICKSIGNLRIFQKTNLESLKWVQFFMISGLRKVKGNTHHLLESIRR